MDALVVAGVDPADLPDPKAALLAIEAAPFVVSLELRTSAVTDRADVVLPVAAVPEKDGTFLKLGGQAGLVRGGHPRPWRGVGPGGARPDRGRNGCPPGAARYRVGAPGAGHAGGLAGHQDERAGVPARRAVPARPGRGRPGHLAPAHRHGQDAGRRAVPRRDGAAGGGADVCGHRE